MVDLTEISAVVAATGVLVGVIYYILDMRHQAKVRQTDLIMRLYSTYGSKEFREAIIEVMNLQFEDYEDYVKKYGAWFSDEPANKAMAMVCVFFEGLGILLREKLIDASLSYTLFSTMIKAYWVKSRPLIEGLRKEFNDPTVFENSENLYNEVKKREQRLSKKV